MLKDSTRNPPHISAFVPYVEAERRILCVPLSRNNVTIANIPKVIKSVNLRRTSRTPATSKSLAFQSRLHDGGCARPHAQCNSSALIAKIFLFRARYSSARYLSRRADLPLRRDANRRPRIRARETSVDIWPSGLADCAKKLLHASVYKMRGLEHGVEPLTWPLPLN